MSSSLLSQSQIRSALQRAIFSIGFLSVLPVHATSGPTARTLAQPLLSAFQHSILSSRAFGPQSKNSLSCVAALPKDSFADIIEDALKQGLSNADLSATDAYFSRPAFSTEIPQLVAQLQGVRLSNAKSARPILNEADQKLESDLVDRDILNKLTLAHYFKTPQVFAAFNARSKDLLLQCAIRKNDVRDTLHPLA